MTTLANSQNGTVGGTVYVKPQEKLTEPPVDCPEPRRVAFVEHCIFDHNDSEVCVACLAGTERHLG